MKKKILVTRKLLQQNESRLQQLFEVKFNIEDKIYSKEELLELSHGCDGILSTIVDQFDVDTINKLSPSTKIIANFAVGFGNINLDAARKKNIAVTNTPEVLSEATADISILLLLGASRRAYEGRKWVEQQNWKWQANAFLGRQMSGAKLGILGMGRIGREVAKRARGFNMEIHYYNRSRLKPDLELGSIYHKDLKSLFSTSDFLSINCPANKDTVHLINKDTLKFFPKHAVIGNAARGDIIKDDDMIEALKNKKIFALGLDVYNGEPKIHPEYLKLKNVFILPHVGSATEVTRLAMGDRAIDNLIVFFENGKPKDLLN